MKNTEFTCTNVLTIASDNQQVTLVNDQAEITIRLKDQNDFGTFEKGIKYSSVIPGALQLESKPKASRAQKSK